MLLSRWLLCFTLLASTTGLAQAAQSGAPSSPAQAPSLPPPPLVPAPEQAEDAPSQEQAPPPGESIPSSYEEQSSGRLLRPDRPGLPTAARITLEIMGGAAAGGVSGFVVLLVADALTDGCGDDVGCILTVLGATGGAIFLTTPLGVYAAGRLAGGQGSYWSTMLGMAVGSGAGVAMAIALNNTGDELQIASLVTLPLLGAVLGYELWHLHQQPDSAGRGRAGASLQLIPLAGFTRGGGVFGGLAARF
jgi:hypothetical protein